MTDFIHWKELNGNKYLTKLHPAMLQGDGYLVERTQAVSRRTKVMQAKQVIFDRSYVIEIFKNQIDLLEIDQDEAIDLIGDAFLELEKERSVRDCPCGRMTILDCTGECNYQGENHAD